MICLCPRLLGPSCLTGLFQLLVFHLHRAAPDRRHGSAHDGRAKSLRDFSFVARARLPTVSENPPSKKSTDPTEELHKRAEKVQETLKRLLAEINDLLAKTKGLSNQQGGAEPGKPPKAND